MVVRSPSRNPDSSDYYPWDYYRQNRSIVVLAKQAARRKTNRHIQPEPGPERAFGDALREIRKEKGISQEQLALDSGLDRTYVSLIERGSQSPTVRNVVRLANMLGVNPSQIIVRMEQLMRVPRPTPKPSQSRARRA